MAIIKSTLIISFLSLVALTSATDSNRMIQLSKRTPVAQPEIPFYHSGLIARQATQPKVVIGTSNPPPQAVNTLEDSTPAVGKNNGVITPFKVKRSPQATQPKVVIGTSNPPPQAVNTLEDSTPAVGKTDGGIKVFKAGGAAGVLGKRFAQSDLNEVSDDQAVSESPDGELEDFDNEDEADFEKRNLIPHHLATRGFADGTIELF